MRQLRGTSQQSDGTVIVAEDVIVVEGITLGDNPINDPQVPQNGAPHPTLSGAFVDSRRLLEWLNPTTARVAVFYSSDRRGRFTPRVRDDDQGFVSFVYQSSPVAIEVEFFERKEFFYSGQGLFGLPTVLSDWKWDRNPKTIEAVESSFSVVYNVTGFSISPTNAIVAQTNKIHVIGGQQWKFVGGSATRLTASLWQIQAEWVQPSSLPAWPVDTVDPTEPRWVGPPARTAFQQYYVVPSPAIGQPPSIEVIDVGDLVPNGWLSLPGPPPL